MKRILLFLVATVLVQIPDIVMASSVGIPEKSVTCRAEGLVLEKSLVGPNSYGDYSYNSSFKVERAELANDNGSSFDCMSIIGLTLRDDFSGYAKSAMVNFDENHNYSIGDKVKLLLEVYNTNGIVPNVVTFKDAYAFEEISKINDYSLKEPSLVIRFVSGRLSSYFYSSILFLLVITICSFAIVRLHQRKRLKNKR